MKANQDMAAVNREILESQGIKVINMISSPGAGKTTILEKTVAALKNEIPLAVIEGDLMTTKDAERIGRHGVPVIQINTNGGCHLDANMVNNAMNELPLDKVRLLIIENVGNLVCPASFDLGEDLKVVVLSIPEGDDKPLKYPSVFKNAGVCILNKIDFLPLSNFNLEGFYQDIASLNDDLKVFTISAWKEEGLQAWYDYLRELVR
jgi:hydrogenase nickel incorporation protein HypB